MTFSTTLRRLLAPALLALAAATPAAAQTAAPLRGFDAYVTQALKDWEVPGVAVAVVHRDSVVLARGYGVRTLGRPEPVDARTLFAIGSASKAFTAALVGMLVDEGKVRWDDPATRHLPGLQLWDPYATRELTVRDLLSHRSGLSRGDLLWYGTENDSEEILRRVRHLKPTWGLRAQFGYQNIMYLAAGQVASRVAGKSWDELVRERLFTPLGMASSSTTLSALRGQANVASPHRRTDGAVRVIDWRNIDNIGPAGSINSSVADMARWVRLQLDSGRVAGKPLLTTSTFVETHTPQTLIRHEGAAREANPFTHFRSYGLGWFLEDYRGREVVQHGGNIDGMSALVGMMPEEDVGVVILSNLDGTGLPNVLMRRVFDLYLGVQGKDWSQDLLAVVRKQQAQAREAEQRQEQGRVAGTQPSLALERYAGTYQDSLYGEVQVRHEGGALVARFGPAFEGDLEHWHYNTFRARWRNPSLGRSLVNFTLGADAKVAKVEVENVGEFTRVERVDTTPGARLAEAELARLTGTFRATDLPVTVQVELIGGALKLTVPGQPVYTLVPESATRFRLTREGMPPGFFFEYRMEGDRVAGASLIQPAPRPTLTLTKVQ